MTFTTLMNTIGNSVRVLPMSEILRQLQDLEMYSETPVSIIDAMKKENLFFLEDDFARMSVIKAKDDGLIPDYECLLVKEFAAKYCNSQYLNPVHVDDKSSFINDYIINITKRQILLNQTKEKFQYDNRKAYPLTFVTKRFEFCAAHQIYGYNGLCANVHGHTWFIEVTLVDNINNDSGFVLDFKELKAYVNKTVLSELDHHMINDVAKSVLRPTAETLLPYIYFKLLWNNENDCLPIYNIRLYESPDSWADLKFKDLWRSNFCNISTYLNFFANGCNVE